MIKVRVSKNATERHKAQNVKVGHAERAHERSSGIRIGLIA